LIFLLYPPFLFFYNCTDDICFSTVTASSPNPAPPLDLTPMFQFHFVCHFIIRGYLKLGDQEGLFELVMLNFIFKWSNCSNFRLLTASH
jgi:hypothetical protein